MDSNLSTSTKRFSVALSFPGEHREIVEAVAELLSEQLGKPRVLYDKFHEAEFARPDLDIYLQKLYHDEAELVVVFLCVDYERKEWTGLEWRAIRDLIKSKQVSSIMLIRLDNANVSGIFSIDGYVNAVGRTAKEIAELITCRLHNFKAECKRLKLESGGAGFSNDSVKECAEQLINLAYYNPQVSLAKIALWWVLSYSLWRESNGEGPFTNADICVSHLPSIEKEGGGVRLDEDMVRLSLAECAHIGYLREVPYGYNGFGYEITEIGRVYFSRRLLAIHKTTD